MSLSDVAQAGNRIETLRALRDMLAAEMDACESARDLAALSRQFTDVLEQIATLDPPKREGTALDELNSRRAARSAGAPRKARAAGG